MSIGIWQIIVLAIAIGVLLGSGYLGIYIFKQNPQFKKYLTTKNVIMVAHNIAAQGIVNTKSNI